jgi:uncharacterized membrane-anchored protein
VVGVFYVGSEESFVKRSTAHMPAWMVATLAFVLASPGIRSEIAGGFVDKGLGASVGFALTTAFLSLVVAGVGGMLSAWLYGLYESKVKNGKHPRVWVVVALLLWVLIVWVALNADLRLPVSSFPE